MYTVTVCRGVAVPVVITGLSKGRAFDILKTNLKDPEVTNQMISCEHEQPVIDVQAYIDDVGLIPDPEPILVHETSLELVYTYP